MSTAGPQAAALPSEASGPTPRGSGASGPWSARRDPRLLLQRLGAPVALAVVVIAGAVAFPGFFTTTNLQDVVLQSTFVGLITVGQTLVLITGGFDLSVGSMVAVACVLSARMAPVAWPLAILVPVAAGGLVGVVNGLLIAKARMAPFIVTLAGLLGLHGVALALAHDTTIRFTGARPFVWLANGHVGGVSVPVIILVVAFAAAGVALNRTRYGVGVFAVGGSEESARMLGVRAERTKIVTYTVSGLLAGFAGALLSAQLHSGIPTAGSGYELQSIAAAVVGGTLLDGGAGTMSGALAGVLLLGVIQNLINQVGTLSSFTQQLVQGAFIIVVVAIQRLLNRRRTLAP